MNGKIGILLLITLLAYQFAIVEVEKRVNWQGNALYTKMLAFAIAFFGGSAIVTMNKIGKNNALIRYASIVGKITYTYLKYNLLLYLLISIPLLLYIVVILLFFSIINIVVGILFPLTFGEFILFSFLFKS